jgi:hypothetical protein
LQKTKIYSPVKGINQANFYKLTIQIPIPILIPIPSPKDKKEIIKKMDLEENYIQDLKQKIKLS